MPTPGLYTTPDAFPKATLRAQRRDRSWMADGRCRGQTGHMRHAWVVDEDRRWAEIDGVRVLTASLISMALKICHTCPVQYQCVAWNVTVDESAGTWGLSASDTHWLKLRGIERALDFVDQAERRGQPIQVAVRRARGRVA